MCEGAPYNPATGFCVGDKLYKICDGLNYDVTQFICGEDNTLKQAKCGGEPYNPVTHFCHTDGETYSCDGEPYDPTTHFCKQSKKIKFCGNNKQEYDPDLYKCNSTINENGIYLIGGITDDRDSKTYDAVLIGTQTWMAKNLNYSGEESNIIGVCSGNDDANCNKYGRLYNWVTAMVLPDECKSQTCPSSIKEQHRGICPQGWHIPSNEDWNVLMNTVNPSCSAVATSTAYCSDAGTKLKATSEWKPVGTDDYGFSALPGGKGFEITGFKRGSDGYWLSTGENAANFFCRSMNNNTSSTVFVYTDGSCPKKELYSIRCVMDN